MAPEVGPGLMALNGLGPRAIRKISGVAGRLPADGRRTVSEMEQLRRLAHERARDRNEGTEPDDLHIAYEVELMRMQAESDVLAELCRRWNAGTRRAAGNRQDALREWWPALADGLDAISRFFPGIRPAGGDS